MPLSTIQHTANQREYWVSWKNKFRQVETSLDKFRQVETSLDKFRMIWLLGNVVRAKQFLEQKYKLPVNRRQMLLLRRPFFGAIQILKKLDKYYVFVYNQRTILRFLWTIMKNMLRLCMFSDNLTQLAKLENFIRLGSLEHCDRLLSTVLQFIWRAATSINKNKLQMGYK